MYGIIYQKSVYGKKYVDTIGLGPDMILYFLGNTGTVSMALSRRVFTGTVAASGGVLAEKVLIDVSWQAYSPLGRGYGFESLAVHQRHVVLETCPSYHATALANESRIVTEAVQEQFVKTHSAEVYKHTSVAQRQCLDIKPGFGGLIKASLFKSK